MSAGGDIIGIGELLDEVSRDLDDFRRKHPADYGVKNITLWWDMEKERLLTRHGAAGVVRKLRARGLKWLAAWFALGCASTLAAAAGLRLLGL